MDFDVQNAQGEQAMCSTIVNNFVSADVDLMLANATLPLQTAAQATADIPIMGTSITDYATALEISDWTGATGINVSGTSDLAPIDEQADMTMELLPDVKTVGILYCSAEPNSKYQAELYAEAMKKKMWNVKNLRRLTPTKSSRWSQAPLSSATRFTFPRTTPSRPIRTL